MIQVHKFDERSFILRVSKCYSFEGNFIYLLFGDTRVLLLDTGGPPNDATPGLVLPLRQTVDSLITAWTSSHGGTGIDLIVAHTHGHGDHVFGDAQFVGRPRTTIVPPTLAGVKSFFGLSGWPNGQASLDLGNRRLVVLPLPGHESSHIAIYHETNKWLFTGDSLYAGVLTVRDWDAYRASAARLAQFAQTHVVDHVLGNHIEMKNQPREFYPIGTTFQPDEHILPLKKSHIDEWNAACQAMAASPHRNVHDDFIIEPL